MGIGAPSVSYTHLDVYKRQAYSNVGLVYLMKAQDYADKATTDINDPKYAEAQAAVKKFYEEDVYKRQVFT